MEVKATLMLIPLRHGRYKLMAVLRSLTIMDTNFTQVSALLLLWISYHIWHLRQIAQNATNSRIKRLMQESPLKRNNNYYDDEERASTRVRVEGEDGQSTEDQGSIHGDMAQSGGQNPHPHTNPMVIN